MDFLPIPLAKSGDYAARAAKRDIRVGASGRPANQAASRSRLMAAAVARGTAARLDFLPPVK